MAESEDFGQTCDECSPCWPHRGWLRVCSCDCHPADPAADPGHAMAVIEHLEAENERLRAIERAARLHVDAAYREHGSVVGGTLTALRAALSGSSE